MPPASDHAAQRRQIRNFPTGQVSAKPEGWVRVLPLPQPAGAGSPLREGAIVCKGKKSGDVRRIRSTTTRPCIQPKPKRHSQPKSVPAARPQQQHPAGYTHQRETHAKHPAKTQGHSQPKRVPAAEPPQQHQAGNTHRRKTAPHAPSQTQAAQPTQKRTGGEAAVAAPSSTNAPAQD